MVYAGLGDELYEWGTATGDHLRHRFDGDMLEPFHCYDGVDRKTGTLAHTSACIDVAFFTLTASEEIFQKELDYYKRLQ